MSKTIWNFDPSHSNIGFAVRHLVISKVRGHFGAWSGTVELNEDDLSKSRLEVSIDAASIDTGVDKRDEHLRSADFFDAENNPTLTFVSTRVEDLGDKGLRVTGDLTIRGTTREVVLDAELTGRGNDPWGGERIGFEAKTSIDRKDFGLTWNQPLETGGVVVGSKIEIGLEVQAVLEAKAAAA